MLWYNMQFSKGVLGSAASLQCTYVLASLVGALQICDVVRGRG